MHSQKNEDRSIKIVEVQILNLKFEFNDILIFQKLRFD